MSGPASYRSFSRLRVWSLLFVAVALGWWWVTRTHAGSWWWAALLNLVPAQVLALWPLLLLGWAWKTKKLGWKLFNLLAIFAVLVALAGFQLPRARHQPAGIPLTILTLNANFAQASPEAVAEVALREGAQVVTIQEALDKGRDGEAFEQRMKAAFPGWTVVRHDELLTVTRLPLLGKQIVPFPHSAHSLLLTEVRVEGQAVAVLNAHLPTLAVLANRSDREAHRTLPQRLERTLGIRRDFQEVVGKLARNTAQPLVLAGDLNAPPRGGVAYQLRSVGWQDAFAQAGVGFGFTHHALLPHSRVDYVWLHQAQAESARPLGDLLSDHRALVVRVRLQP